MYTVRELGYRKFRFNRNMTWFVRVVHQHLKVQYWSREQCVYMHWYKEYSAVACKAWGHESVLHTPLFYMHSCWILTTLLFCMHVWLIAHICAQTYSIIKGLLC